MEQDNAARRLCNMFNIAFEEGDGNKYIYVVLGLALGILDPENNKHLVTEVFVMLSEVDKELKKLQKVNNIQMYINGVQEIQYYLVTSNIFQGTWNQLKTNIENRNFILILDSCANFIAIENPTIALSKTQLTEYLKQCEDLLAEVIISELSDDIKTYLVERLEEVCTAIRNYKIGGSKRLQIIIESNIGGIVLHNEDYTPEQKKGIIGKIFNFLITIGSLLDFGANTEGYLLPKLASLAKFLLPPG